MQKILTTFETIEAANKDEWSGTVLKVAVIGIERGKMREIRETIHQEIESYLARPSSMEWVKITASYLEGAVYNATDEIVRKLEDAGWTWSDTE